MFKNCRYCGKPLPEEAAFCPYCARSQLDAQEAPEPPKPSKRPSLLLILLLAAAVLLVCGGWRLLHAASRPVEVPPETTGTHLVQGDRIPSLLNGPDGYLEYREETPEGQTLYHLILSKTGEDAEVSVFLENGTRVEHYYTPDVKGTLAARGIDLDALSADGQKENQVTP